MKGSYVVLIALVACAALTPLPAAGDVWQDQINNTTRFVVLSSYNNQAVLDQETGLVWQQSPSSATANWSMSHDACTVVTVGNRLGWRLPTIQELASLIDPTVPPPGPFLPAGHPFSNVLGTAYWSASTRSDNTGIAWFGMLAGAFPGGVGTSSKTTMLLHWCVRGGQGVDPQ